MDSIALLLLGAMSLLKKVEKLAEKVAEGVAKYLLSVLLPPGVMKKAEKLTEKMGEMLMPFGHDRVEPASLQHQCLNHGASLIAGDRM